MKGCELSDVGTAPTISLTFMTLRHKNRQPPLRLLLITIEIKLWIPKYYHYMIGKDNKRECTHKLYYLGNTSLPLPPSLSRHVISIFEYL